jgi:isochorismate synthase
MQDVLGNTMKITGAINSCLGRNISFAIFRLPAQESITLIIQKDPVPQVLGQLSDHLPAKGFIIAPFSREHNDTWLIKPDMVINDIITAEQLAEIKDLPEKEPHLQTLSFAEDTGKEEYMQLIADSIEKINAGEFEKVVLSRIKSVKGNFAPYMEDIFQNLCNSYKHAFVYLFCVDGQCWTGATPEPFICSDKNELKTVSLAGTRTYREQDMNLSNWNGKELQEQEYVTLHIEKILREFNVSGYKKTGPFVTKAGNLLHLRTDFEFSADTIGSRLPSLITSLHPTPAVCGMSTGKAMDFIRATEKHNREYYAGFLGPVGLSDRFRLYVNLRCLKVYEDRLVLFIGGGITQDSNPEEEWEETEMKADTLLSVLNKIK